MVRGRSVDGSLPTPFFSLSLAGGGSGWGSPAAAVVHPPPDLPPVMGEEYGWSGGGSGWGSVFPFGMIAE